MLIDLANRRVLVLAPHTDDGELGCGATIARLVEMKSDVHYVAFSDCEDSLPAGVPRNALRVELAEAARVLGLSAENVVCEKFKVRLFFESRQDILQSIIGHRNRIDPELVLMPTMQDIHQDHGVVAAEGLRAFKDRTILCYELPWNNLTFSTTAFVKVEERHVGRKIDALKRYASQTSRRYMNDEVIRAIARTRGVQIGCDFAEAFEVMRLTV